MNFIRLSNQGYLPELSDKVQSKLNIDEQKEEQKPFDDLLDEINDKTIKLIIMNNQTPTSKDLVNSFKPFSLTNFLCPKFV